MPGERRDMDAARCFFARSLEVVGHAHGKVATGGHDACPGTIRETLGEGVVHRRSQYLNNRTEQDHRGIEGHYHPMRGFGTFASASRFCSAHDEVRDSFRHRTRMREVVPVGVRREQFRARSAALRALIEAARAPSVRELYCSCGVRCSCRCPMLQNVTQPFHLSQQAPLEPVVSATTSIRRAAVSVPGSVP